MQKRVLKARKGFTLIELLVVVVIIGILASVAMPSFVSAQDRARNATLSSNVKVVQTALESYAADHNGSFPNAGRMWAKETNASKEGQDDGIGIGIGTNNYLPGNKAPKSPWGGKPQTRAIITEGKEAIPMFPVSDLTTGDESVVGLIKPGNYLQVEDSGAAVKPDQSPQKIFQYGALVVNTWLDNDDDPTQYVVYATGKKNGRPILGDFVNNLGIK